MNNRPRGIVFGIVLLLVVFGILLLSTFRGGPAPSHNSVADVQKPKSEIGEPDLSFGGISKKLGALFGEARRSFADVAGVAGELSALTSWLSSDVPRHVLVMFQNPSELRPAGGFFGSYADVVVEKGSVVSVDVRDISDADRELTLKTVPPRPLQRLVKNWRAADANYFFNFPDSARTVLAFMNASELDSKLGLVFDSAVAISPKVLESALALTGSVAVADKMFTPENFLVEIQKSVQEGQARLQDRQAQDASYPKQVLKEIAARVLDALAAAGEAKQRQFFDALLGLVESKDVMAYSGEPGIQNFIERYGASGGVYKLPENFTGDYLAVVDANVGGGKSDLFMKRAVTFESELGTDGVVKNHLVLEASHEGNVSGDWWYKVPNENYLQVFVPPSGELVKFEGGTEKNIAPPLDYEKAGYKIDPLVAEIESGAAAAPDNPSISVHQESGKKVFSTWSKVAAGESAKIIFDYSHKLPAPLSDGGVYQFIFEKQAGTEREYRFKITAPPGFVFAEAGTPVYEYVSTDPSGRLVASLTLRKIDAVRKP